MASGPHRGQPLVSVKIFIEGGGDYEETKAALRRGFGKLFEKIVPHGRRPRIAVCGGRDQTFKDFRNAPRQTSFYNRFLLIVDSEGPINPGAPVWAYLAGRDGWERPEGAAEADVHLMVQCMEAWFLADPGNLIGYYGEEFLRRSLPRRSNIEDISKGVVVKALDHATQGCQGKGAYHKTRHAPDLLERLDPKLLRTRSAFFDRLCRELGSE